MERGGRPTETMPRASVAFGSRPYRPGDAARALDATVAGLRTLGMFAGASESAIDEAASISELVRVAEPGVRSYVGDRRATYSALFVAAGARCRSLLAALHRPAGMDRVTDPVVASSMAAEVNRVAGGESATLLRMALAAEASMGTGVGRSARNPLGGVLDLLEMGAVLTTRRGEPEALVLGDGRRVDLEWTGAMFTKSGPGRLVLSDEGGLSF